MVNPKQNGNRKYPRLLSKRNNDLAFSRAGFFTILIVILQNTVGRVVGLFSRITILTLFKAGQTWINPRFALAVFLENNVLRHYFLETI